MDTPRRQAPAQRGGDGDGGARAAGAGWRTCSRKARARRRLSGSVRSRCVSSTYERPWPRGHRRAARRRAAGARAGRATAGSMPVRQHHEVDRAPGGVVGHRVALASPWARPSPVRLRGQRQRRPRPCAARRTCRRPVLASVRAPATSCERQPERRARQRAGRARAAARRQAALRGSAARARGMRPPRCAVELRARPRRQARRRARRRRARRAAARCSRARAWRPRGRGELAAEADEPPSPERQRRDARRRRPRSPPCSP